MESSKFFFSSWLTWWFVVCRFRRCGLLFFGSLVAQQWLPNSPSTWGCVRENGGKVAVQRGWRSLGIQCHLKPPWKKPHEGIGRQGTAHLILPILRVQVTFLGLFFFVAPNSKVGLVGANPTFWGMKRLWLESPGRCFFFLVSFREVI